MTPRPLILDWFPVTELGIECHRENSTGRHPPLNRMHVWWARRPLVLSAAAVLASLLPADGGGEFESAAAYHAWFLRLLGITGDPVAGQARLRVAGVRRLSGNPYGYPRAFSRRPQAADLELLDRLLSGAWGPDGVLVADPMAGGGSIPFAALRYGLGALANELNPVAAVILRVTLEYPARFGPGLAEDINHWGGVWAERVRENLEKFYPSPDVHGYLWARTVICPSTGRQVPLAPSWWLRRGEYAARLEAGGGFRVVRGEPGPPTVRRGIGRSPWTGEPIGGDHIKAEAAAGRMGQQLYALALKRAGRLSFRPPAAADLAAVARAEEELARWLPTAERDGLVPVEVIPPGQKTGEPLRYGMTAWKDLFAPRQLLAATRSLAILREMAEELDGERGRAVVTCLALALDKAVSYNSRLARWHSGRGVVAGAFDRHDFSLKWSHAEVDAARKLLPWAVGQVAGAYRELSSLLPGERRPLISCGDAASLAVKDGSAHLVCVDPPYYDNVMYSELSDFFYVWLKRSLGGICPDLFGGELTPKGAEAVANPARSGSRRVAGDDYRQKMTACFREMRRLLRPDGLLTVMFTHKRVEAWDTLAAALLEAGLGVRAAWPVRTESAHSLHQAGKQAAGCTVLLVCSRREGDGGARWEDIQEAVRRAAREAAAGASGLTGVDREIATFGPALAVISAHWPVTVAGGLLSPGQALELAREAVGGS
ncbi:MAG: DUF1156 domain-containing protein [bacterium]|nr:DUF1156 domain-containing protein [bacterium]